MMVYKCRCCKALFTTPIVDRIRENLDEENGWWTYTELLCPSCGSENIEEVRYDKD